MHLQPRPDRDGADATVRYITQGSPPATSWHAEGVRYPPIGAHHTGLLGGCADDAEGMICALVIGVDHVIFRTRPRWSAGTDAGPVAANTVMNA